MLPTKSHKAHRKFMGLMGRMGHMGLMISMGTGRRSTILFVEPFALHFESWQDASRDRCYLDLEIQA